MLCFSLRGLEKVKSGQQLLQTIKERPGFVNNCLLLELQLVLIIIILRDKILGGSLRNSFRL